MPDVSVVSLSAMELEFPIGEVVVANKGRDVVLNDDSFRLTLDRLQMPQAGSSPVADLL